MIWLKEVIVLIYLDNDESFILLGLNSVETRICYCKRINFITFTFISNYDLELYFQCITYFQSLKKILTQS